MASSRCSEEAAAQLLARGRGGDFFALLDQIERLTRGAPRPGDYGPIDEERLRLRHDPSLGFSASDVRSVTRDDDGRWTVMTTFLGLTGVVTPLPLTMAEEVLLEDGAPGPMRDFLDIFHHRVLSLLYRLVSKHDWPRGFRRDAGDRWSRCVLDLLGVGGGAETGARVPAIAWLRLAPLLCRRARTPRDLTLALEDILRPALAGARVSITQFTGSWVAVDASQQMRLGGAGGQSQLGPAAVLGRNAFLRAGRFRVLIKPLTNQNFRRFLPGGDLLPVIDEVVQAFQQGALEYELELVLASGGTPRFSLGGDPPARLGQDTWLSGVCSVETSIVVQPSREERE